MRKLTKGAKPNILIQKASLWTSELMGYIRRGEEVPKIIKERYNHQEIKDALKKETYGKCMYCEGEIGSVAYPHIEHFRPKSLYPELTFEWNNLGLGCPVCNINKHDVFNTSVPFINPYEENPDDAFVFLGTMIKQKPGCIRAEFMISQLDLNRGELMEQRKAAIDNVSHLVERYVAETDPSVKQILRHTIKAEYGPGKPFSRSVKSAVEILTREKWNE